MSKQVLEIKEFLFRMHQAYKLKKAIKMKTFIFFKTKNKHFK